MADYEKLNHFREAYNFVHKDFEQFKLIPSKNINVLKFKCSTVDNSYTCYLILKTNYISYYVKGLYSEKSIRTTTPNDYFDDVRYAFIKMKQDIDNNTKYEQMSLKA